MSPLQILDTMGAAAELMSTPPLMLEQGTAADPRVKPNQRLAAAREAVAGTHRTGACLKIRFNTLGALRATRP